MDNIKQYILSILIAAILCSIIKSIFHGSNMMKQLIRFLSGIFMTLTILAPLKQIDLQTIADYKPSFLADVEDATTEGIKMADDERIKIIKQNTEAYILDKAQSFGVDAMVEVMLAQEQPFLPTSITISGTFSPYNRKQLATIIAQDLGIPEEDQIWD